MSSQSGSGGGSTKGASYPFRVVFDGEAPTSGGSGGDPTGNQAFAPPSRVTERRGGDVSPSAPGGAATAPAYPQPAWIAKPQTPKPVAPVGTGGRAGNAWAPKPARYGVATRDDPTGGGAYKPGDKGYGLVNFEQPEDGGGRARNSWVSNGGWKMGASAEDWNAAEAGADPNDERNWEYTGGMAQSMNWKQPSRQEAPHLYKYRPENAARRAAIADWNAKNPGGFFGTRGIATPEQTRAIYETTPLRPYVPEPETDFRDPMGKMVDPWADEVRRQFETRLGG